MARVNLLNIKDLYQAMFLDTKLAKTLPDANRQYRCLRAALRAAVPERRGQVAELMLSAYSAYRRMAQRTQ